MLNVVAAILTTVGGCLALGQLGLRLRAHGCEQLRVPARRWRELFDTIIDQHGVALSEGDAHQYRTFASELADLRDRVRDDELRDRATELVRLCKLTVATAPATVKVAQRSPDPIPDWQQQAGQQVSAARDGVLAVQRLLDRCNELTRWIVGDPS